MRYLSLLVASLVGLAETPYAVEVIAGSDWVGDGGPATRALLMHVEGVAADLEGNVYIADADGHRVRKVSPAGIITTVAGTGVRGFSGDEGPAARAQLNTPYGVAVDGLGNLYIADLGNARVRRVGLDGRIGTVAGGGSLMGADAEGSAATAVKLASPRNLALDLEGYLYISDFGAHRVYRLGYGGSLVTVAGTGEEGYSGDGGAARRGQLAYPTALAAERGALFIADSQNHVVRKVAGGIITTAARAAIPTGLALDGLGNLFIADSGTGQILRLARGEGAVTTLRVPARDVALGRFGALYAASGDLVRRIAADGAVELAAGGGDTAHGDGGNARDARLNRPASVARDGFGNLYIADRANHRVRRVSAEGIITTVAGTGEPGGSGDGGPAALAQLNSPSSVAVDAAGGLYIADTGNHRVRKITPAGVITTMAGTGARGSEGDGGPARLARLDSPAYAIPDAEGNLYIADTGNQRIRKVEASGTISAVVTALAGPRGMAFNGAGDLCFTEAGGRRVRRLTRSGALTNLAAGSWSAPQGITVSAAGDVFVADAGRLLRLDASERVTVVAEGLGSPQDVAADPSGALFVAEAEHHRVLKLTPAPVLVEPLRAAEAVNAASLRPGPVAPGMLLALLGTGLTTSDLADARIEFSGIPAPPLALEGDRLYVQVPAAAGALRNAEITVLLKNNTRARIAVAVADAAPALFPALLNEDGTENSAENAAPRGSLVTLYGTGEGIGGQPLALRIGDYDAEIVWAGPAPGYPGLLQINARVPSGYAPPGRLPVTLEVGSISSPPGVTVSTR